MMKRAAVVDGENDELRPLAADDVPPLPVGSNSAALVARYRGGEDTVRRARVHLERALNSIEAFPDGAARRALHEAAVFAVERDR